MPPPIPPGSTAVAKAGTETKNRTAKAETKLKSRLNTLHHPLKMIKLIGKEETHMKKNPFLWILIGTLLLFTGTWPIVILLAFPLAIIYAIYRAIIGIMTHNAELKSRYGNQNRDEH